MDSTSLWAIWKSYLRISPNAKSRLRCVFLNAFDQAFQRFPNAPPELGSHQCFHGSAIFSTCHGGCTIRTPKPGPSLPGAPKFCAIARPGYADATGVMYSAPCCRSFDHTMRTRSLRDPRNKFTARPLQQGSLVGAAYTRVFCRSHRATICLPSMDPTYEYRPTSLPNIVVRIGGARYSTGAPCANAPRRPARKRSWTGVRTRLQAVSYRELAEMCSDRVGPTVRCVSTGIAEMPSSRSIGSRNRALGTDSESTFQHSVWRRLLPVIDILCPPRRG